jgi:predicted flap endonuclease-1-like 5' DNA nuclease
MLAAFGSFVRRRIQCAGAGVGHAARAIAISMPVNALAILALIAIVIAIGGVAYRAGARHARRASDDTAATRLPAPSHDAMQTSPRTEEPLVAEWAQLRAFAEDRRRLFGDVADARAEIARYRQIVVDIERNAPPPLLDAPGTPDDLKLIVGVGPVIERMLYQMGIATYRQIARWSERDIDEVDARLPEFPGRIRRDGWVTQARSLHIGKYGTTP